MLDDSLMQRLVSLLAGFSLGVKDVEGFESWTINLFNFCPSHQFSGSKEFKQVFHHWELLECWVNVDSVNQVGLLVIEGRHDNE
jgi:hypothetical protein